MPCSGSPEVLAEGTLLLLPFSCLYLHHIEVGLVRVNHQPVGRHVVRDDFSTSWGLTGLRLKLQCLSWIGSFSLASGSVAATGILSLRSLTLLRKKSFMAPASLAGLVEISPFINSLVGGPEFPQLSQGLILLQIVLELCWVLSSLFCSHVLFSVLILAVTVFLRCLYALQSLLLWLGLHPSPSSTPW